MSNKKLKVNQILEEEGKPKTTVLVEMDTKIFSKN